MTKQLLNRLPSWLRALVITSVQTFIAGVLLTILTVMNQLSNDDPINGTAVVRDVRVLALAALIPLVTGLHRKVSPPEQSYDARDPQLEYPEPFRPSANDPNA